MSTIIKIQKLKNKLYLNFLLRPVKIRSFSMKSLQMINKVTAFDCKFDLVYINFC